MKIQRFPAIKGIYGERIGIDTRDKELVNFFHLVSLWRNDLKYDNETRTSTVIYELPIGVSIKDVPLSLAIERLGVEVKEQ